VRSQVYNNNVRDITASGTMYGFYTATASAVDAYQNQLYNITSTAGTIYGFYITTSGSTANFYRNSLREITTAGATTSVFGFYVVGGTTSNLYNNYVGNLSATASTSNTAATGIYISSTTNINLYNNTVYLSFTNSSGSTFGSSCIWVTSATPILRMQNNIFYSNVNPGPTGGACAVFRYSVAPGASYSSLSNNNCFFNNGAGGTKPLYCEGTAATVTNPQSTIAAYKAFMSTKDQSSISEDVGPLFLSTTSSSTNFLRMGTGVATQTESGGANLSSIFSNDYDGDARTGTAGYVGTGSAYDIGADEFDGIPSDQTAPNISHTGLGVTCSTSDRTFNVTITDATGVPLDPASTVKPRVYFKKGIAGTYTSTPATFVSGDAKNGVWSFNIEAAGMSGLALYDTVYYYLVAQDSAVSNSAGANPSSGAVLANVNTVTTDPTSPYSYVISATLSGVINVGSGQTFATLTAAAAAYSNSCISGAVTYNLTDAAYNSTTGEVFPITFTSNSTVSAANYLTIKPASGVTPIIRTGNKSGFVLSGADYMVIDGSNTVGGTTKDLTIHTDTFSTNICGVLMANPGTNPATNNMVKNCVVRGPSNRALNATAQWSCGIAVSGATFTGSGSNNDSNTIKNNRIYNYFMGITVKGTGTTGMVRGTIIEDNTIIDSIDYVGVELQQTISPIVRRNEIGASNSMSTYVAGIFVNTSVNDNALIYQNTIRKVNNFTTSGWYAYGIYLGAPFTASAGHHVYNNLIYDMRTANYNTTSAFNAHGIYVAGNNAKIYNNSIRFYGPVTAGTNAGSSFCVYIASGITGINFENNVLENKTEFGVSGSFATAIYCFPGVNFTAGGSCNRNIYYAANSTSNAFTTANLMYNATTATRINSLALIQAATLQDANSSVDDPYYNPLPSLKMDPSSYAKNNASVVSTPAVTTDYDGATRSVTTPSIGAYETFNDLTGPRYSFANLVNPTSLGNVSVTGITITDPSGVDMSVGNKPRLYYRKNSEANAFVGNTSSDNGWKYVEPTNAASPFSFTMDVSLLSSALVPNDTIKYFFTAQDSLSRVSISQGAYTTTTQASISALSGADFPIVGANIKQIQIVLPPMAGDYTIGTGADYNSVTAAINDINLRGVSAAVNLKVQNSYRVSNEPSFPITIGVLNGASAVNTITLKPDAGATPTIEGSFAGAIIKLAGTRYFTIDGSNNGTNSRDLTIRNNIRATTGATAIWISSLGTGAGATRDIVKNCIISTNHYSGTANFNTYGIYVGDNATISTTNPGIDNDTLSFINNQIVKSHYGIFVNGTAGTTSMADSIVIMNNDIGRDSIGFMGIFLQQVNKALVKGNEVHNIATIATNPIGINISTLSKNIDIIKNKVYDLNYTGTGGYGAKGINIANAEDTSNINIINNVIYNINGDGYTSSIPNDAPTGIMLTTATGGINIYNNSINLSATRAGYNSTTVTADVMLQSAVVGPINMVNNVLVNTFDNTTVTTDKNTAVYNLTATSVFGTMDYNHYFVSGPQALLGFFNADLSDLTAYQGAFGGNVNSKDSNPGFNTSTILVLNLGSSALNTGTPLAAVTEDYLGTTRSATNPSRGAFEVGGDAAPPTIVFTNSSNRQLSGSTLAFTGIAAITDYSGVDTTAGTAPRMYYKKFSDANTYVGNSSSDNGWKYVETSSTSTPFSFTMDLSILSGGTYAIGDTIQYFFAAKDLTPAGNSGISPSLLNTPTTSPSLVAANFPVYGTIPRFNLVDAPMAGNYNIGAGQTAPNYATINAAMSDLSLRGVNAPVTLSLLDASYSLATGETFPISVPIINGSSTTNTVTLRPATGVTANITAAANTSTIKFLGTKNFIIDGSNNGTTSRNLTIANTNIRSLGVGNTVAIWFASQGAGLGCSRDIVKNTIIENPYFYNGSNLTSFGILVGDNTNISSGTAGIDNDTLSFINNRVTKANTAILVKGTPASMSDSILIANNDFGSDSLFGNGMWIEQVRYSQITGNSVHNLNTSTALPIGIYLHTGDSNLMVSKNIIYDIHTTGTLAGGKGIYVNTGVAVSNIDIINNVIHSIDGFGYINSSLAYANSGINFGPVTTGAVRVYNNSINLNGNYAGYNGTSVTAPIVVQANVVGPLDIRNNVLTNTYDNTTVTTDVNCGIYSAAANTVFSNVDFNAYYTAGPQSAIGFLTTAQTTLAGMQTAFGGNTNSTITNPNLNSNTILAPQAGSVVLATGTPLAAVTEDFLGNARSLTTPSKGAYEVGGDYAGPSFVFTSLANASTTSSRTLNVTLTDATGVPTSGAGLPMAYYKINAAGTWTSSQGAHVSGNTYQFTIGGGTVNNDTTFYYLVAQDVLGNISANVFNGIGTLTATPPAAASAPTNPLSYRTLPSVSGNYLVGIGQTYTSLTDTTNGFFKFVNSSAVEGNVTVEITSDVTELGLVELNDFGSAYNMTITPQNATVTTLRGYNRPTHMIGIKATNVTFDGSVAGSGKYLRMIVYNNTPASCNAAIRLTSTNNFVCKNVIFEGNSTANPLFNVFASTPGNFNPKIMGCIFQDTVSAAAPSLGINSTSTTVRGLIVGGFNPGEGNEFRNITTNAVNLSGTTDSVKVVGNSIYRTTTTTTAPTYINYSGTAIGSVVIANNHFGGSDATRGGNALNITTTTGSSTMISISAANNAVHRIYGNTISNLGSVSGALVGINVSGTTRAYIYENTIGGGATVSDTVRNGADNGMITSSTSDSVRIYNNTIGNVAYYKASGDRTAGIYCTSGFYHITNNTIRDFKSNGTATGVSTLYPLAGIHITSSSLQGTTGMNIIKGNNIYNFTQINTGAASYVTVGIHMGGSSNATVDGNRIYGFACNGVGVGASAPALFGITAYSTADLDIINNQISISNNSSSFIKAIEINSTDTNNIYNNSIYVGGTSSVATNSYGIYRTGSSTTNKITIKNNLIYNGRVRTTGTSGNHYAIGTSTGANLAGGLFTVSNNAYLDSNSVASFDTAGACNYAGWATKTGDVSNFYSTDAYPSTVFANVANADLTHAMVIANDSGASVAATSLFGGALLDFAGVTRSATPDIGALEFTPATGAILNLTAYLQGLYLGGGMMNS
ncbi:MAG: beta strand repeat-containing protein, partial [Dolichospermum sp.]